MKVRFLGHATFQISSDSGLCVYFDPWQVPDGLPKADVVLVSHDHYDHCSPADLAKLEDATTVVAGPTSVQRKLAESGLSVSVVDAGQSIELQGLRVRAVEAYNVNKCRPTGEPFHPREARYVGFVAELDGVRIYYAGDTDVIPQEVEQDGPIDLAFIPVSGGFVMTPSEAAGELSERPFRYVVPMHYGAIVGSREEAEDFERKARSQVVIFEEGESRPWPPVK
jgi:L-ascorbate metabolism protein UlaG (beta-lactamase superfamily)